jgi:phosphatidylinositol alpha-mannosyltransferase
VRIALVCPYAWDDAGGVQVHVRELGMRLLAAGHDVLGLTPARRTPSEPWVRAIGRPMDIPYNASNAPIDPRPWSRTAVRRALTAFQPDVVHVHEPFAPSTGLWATLEARAPLVATFHSGATRARLYDLAAPVLRRVARRLAIRVAVSERAAAFARARIGGAFRVVPNAVDVGRFASAEPREDLVALGGRRLLFVGRLDDRKGFVDAVGAFGRLADTRPDLRLVVAGDGPRRAAVDALAPAMRERVTMLGAVENADLPPVHAACEVFVAPNTGGESFGIVLLEAMAAGLPVVATDILGFDEVVRGEVDGVLVPARDAAALAAAVARVLDDDDLRDRLAAAARERAAAFDWPVVLTRLVAIYEEATRLPPPSRRQARR